MQQAPDVWLLAASMGGPSALREFCSELPAVVSDNVAFVVAQHIDPMFLDSLKGMLSDLPGFGVQIIDRTMRLEPGQIYLVPVQQQILFLGSELVAVKTKQWDGLYAPDINQVLREMSSDDGRCAGVIVFSGMCDDGAEACQEFHQAGGRVWIQSLESCDNQSMPESVASLIEPNFSGSPSQLAAELSSLYKTNNEKIA